MEMTGWPVPIVPLQMGVLQFPVPSARRFHKLGQALRLRRFGQDQLRVTLLRGVAQRVAERVVRVAPCPLLLVRGQLT